MALFDTLRLASCATVLVFSLIVLGISGYWVSQFQDFVTVLATSSSFSLAVSVITWAFLFPMQLVTTASYTTSLSAGLTINCDLEITTTGENFCRQYQAIQAFSWLNWLILFAYIVLVVVFAVKAMNKGQSVWTMEITDLSATSSGSATDGSTIAASNYTVKPTQPNHNQQPQYNQPMQQYPQGAQV
ncbi:unnamed protein product [Rhizoctonia solani]|nr:unnamed protein product [Rhizoctonia solani]